MDITHQVLITTRVGKYIWYPALQLIDFVNTDEKTTHTIHLLESNNTELEAMIKATTDMLNLLKKSKKERKGNG